MNKTSAMNKNLSDVAFRNIALGQNYFSLTGRAAQGNHAMLQPASAREFHLGSVMFVDVW